MHKEESINCVIDQYDYPGAILGVKGHGNGHINDTYIVEYRDDADAGKEKRRIVQRINTYVFKNPYHVMSNIEGITTHLRKKITAAGGDADRETLTVIKTRDGKDFCFDEKGQCYRAYLFIDKAVTKETVESAQDMYEAAKVFGRFQSLLSDYPVETLYDTIPHFHNTKVRYDHFLDAITQDAKGRAVEVVAEIQFVKERAAEVSILVDLLEAGHLPLRVTHNDTKLNNVLMDEDTGKGLCAMDLDTVMPGLSLYDFGDAIRYGTNNGGEDERDLRQVFMSLPYFEAYTKGYLEMAGEALWDKEIEMLPMGAKIISLECGMRFLMDYIQGDIYFKTHREKQNLDRCRAQFKMVQEIERNWDTMHEIVKKHAR